MLASTMTVAEHDNARRRLSDRQLGNRLMECLLVLPHDEGASLSRPFNHPIWRIQMKKVILTLAALCSVAVFTTGCNTVAGAGKDIERAGEKIENSAQKNK